MMSHELATAWQEGGHDVHVVTITPLDGEPEVDDLYIVRQPSFARLWTLMRRCDVFVQSGVSLRSLLLPIVAQRPIVFIHHDALDVPAGGRMGLRRQLKRIATHLGQNVAVSRAVADSLPAQATIIPNTFRPAFREIPSPDERSGLLFVGRLVSDKGADLALDALARLHGQGEPLSLTICGDGPERAALEQQAEQLGLREHVHFAGWTAPDEMAEHYAGAEATLVPSRYEPFGIVALEALACGCPVVVAHVDGLPEAVGPCGLFFDPGEADELAKKIRQIRRPEIRERLMAKAPAHVARHEINRIAEEYLDVFHSVLATN